MRPSAFGVIAVVVLASACGEPTSPPPADPPRVSLVPAATNLADTKVPVEITVTGCAQVSRLAVYDRDELLKVVPYAGNPTRVELARTEVPYTRGIAAELSLRAEVTCADGRTSKSFDAPVRFLPVAEVLRLGGGGQVVTDVFSAEGATASAAFVGCTGNPDGTTSLVRVNRSGVVVSVSSALPFHCTNETWFTDVNAATGIRWAVQPGVGAFAFDAALQVTGSYVGSVQRLGVGPDGDAIVYDDQDHEFPVKRIAYQGGGAKWGYLAAGVLLTNPSVQPSGVFLPVFANPFGAGKGTVAIQRVRYSDGAFIGDSALKEISYGVGDPAPIPPASFNPDASLLFFPWQAQPGASFVLACSTVADGCSGSALAWQSPSLTGQVVATFPFAAGSIVAAIAPRFTWFLDAATGQVLNRDAQPVSPDGALVTMMVQPGNGRDFYLLNGSGQPGSLPLEVIAIDDPARGALWRYQVHGSNLMAGVDDEGQAWLRVGPDLVRPLSLREYREVVP